MFNSSKQTPGQRLRALPRGARGRRAVAVLAAVAISAGAIACGSGDDDGESGAGSEPLSTDAYLKQVNAAQTDFATDAERLNLANPASAKDFGNSLGSLEGLIDTLRKRLDDLAPPEEVAGEQDDLVQQLRDYGNAIARQKGALTSGNPRRAQAAAQKVGRASTDFSREFDATIAQVNDDLGLEPSATSSSR